MNSGNDVFENEIPNLLVAYVAYVKLYHDTFSVLAPIDAEVLEFVETSQS